MHLELATIFLILIWMACVEYRMYLIYDRLVKNTREIMRRRRNE